MVWIAPVFNADGTLRSPAVVTVFHNGVLVQDGFRLRGATVFRGEPAYTAHGPTPLKLQAHNDPARRLPSATSGSARSTAAPSGALTSLNAACQASDPLAASRWPPAAPRVRIAFMSTRRSGSPNW